MLKQTLLVSGAVLGALTFGSQAVSADTVDVNDGTNTGTSQPSTQPSDTGSTTLPPAQSSSNSDTNSGTGGSSSHTDNSSVDDGTHVDNGGSSSSGSNDKGNGSNSSSTDDKDNSSNSSSTDDKGNGSNSSNTDDKGNGSNSSSTDDKGNGSNSSNTDENRLPNNGKAPDVVPLTPTTPDVNDKGQLNQVALVPVAQPKQGQAQVVPEQVATVPSVARAVEAYNATLSSNNSDATQAPVIEAKKKVDDAVLKALPKTGVRQKQSSVSVLGIALTALASGLAFVFKKKLG
ncbi:serine-rich aggregation substance UasX [Leuconostoc citreum]|uniref:serine-rich aggregation substance UasX n=1 Tax=Leuconostoc citreum TaxID=33964 RepID=UPI000BFEE625|nr:serine-rich aggregation substance UasX [Leuconostoc citreum]